MQIIQHLKPIMLPKVCTWEACGNAGRGLRLRQALALPIYTVGLALDVAAAAVGRLVAWVAGDDWPG
jgi:hypothetical protein